MDRVLAGLVNRIPDIVQNLACTVTGSPAADHQCVAGVRALTNGQLEQISTQIQRLPEMTQNLDRDEEFWALSDMATMTLFMIPVVMSFKCIRIANRKVKEWVTRLEEFQESLRLKFESTPENADFLLSVSSSSYEWQDHPDYAVLRRFQQETNLKFFCTPLLSSMLYSDTDIQEFVEAGKKTKYGVLCFDPSISHYRDCSNPFIGHVCMRELVFTAQNPGRTRVYFPDARKSTQPNGETETDETIGLLMDTKYFHPSNRNRQEMQVEPELQQLMDVDDRWFRLGMTRVADIDRSGPQQPDTAPTKMVYVYLFPKPFAPASIVAMCLHSKLPSAVVWKIMHFLQIAYYAHISRPGPRSSVRYWSWWPSRGREIEPRKRFETSQEDEEEEPS